MSERVTYPGSVRESNSDSAAVRTGSTAKPLPANVQASFGSRFGFDFSRVGIHDDATASDVAASHRAQAVTYGRDVMFARGRYAPGTPQGDRLLAHELAHVVQQAQGSRRATPIDAEARADAAAAEVTRGHRVSPHALGGALERPQAKPEDAPVVVPGLTAGPMAPASAEIEADETITKSNPKVVQIAESYKANPGARVALSANLTSDAKNSSEKERAERQALSARMGIVRSALESLGVPHDAIDISPATAYSTSAHGQVSAAVTSRPTMPTMPGVLLPPPGLLPPANIPPAPPSSLPSLDLEFTFGPVTVSLPKEVRAKLPIPLRGAKKLVVELSAQVPGKFAFSLTLDGLPHVRISLKADAKVDTKDSSVTGSAGLVIETVSSICDSPDPGETREKIKAAGDTLNKAAQEYQAATGSDKLDKAFDIAGALGEIYEAVDKAKGKCKAQPRATVEFGYKRLPPSGGTGAPPVLPPSDYVGITATFHF
jgi:hypothetical protein